MNQSCMQHLIFRSTVCHRLAQETQSTFVASFNRGWLDDAPITAAAVVVAFLTPTTTTTATTRQIHINPTGIKSAPKLSAQRPMPWQQEQTEIGDFAAAPRH